MHTHHWELGPRLHASQHRRKDSVSCAVSHRGGQGEGKVGEGWDSRERRKALCFLCGFGGSDKKITRAWYIMNLIRVVLMSRFSVTGVGRIAFVTTPM